MSWKDDVELTTIGKLIGLINPDGSPNEGWFQNSKNELEGIPKRVEDLLALFENLLGEGEDPPETFTNTKIITNKTWQADTQWIRTAKLFDITNPLDGTPTSFYLVAPPAEPPPTSAVVGIGIMDPTGFGDLTFTAYGFFPLFEFSTTAKASFVLTEKSSHFGVRVSAGKPFGDKVTFDALTLDVDIDFGSGTPGMELVFEGIQGNGSTPGSYSSLSELGPHLKTVAVWIGDVVTGGSEWLNRYVGRSSWTIGGLLQQACIFDPKADAYAFNVSYIESNDDKPEVLVGNFLLNLLFTLADSDKPLIPISAGGEGSGIYVVKEPNKELGGTDFGARLMIQDITLGSDKGAGASAGTKKAKPEVAVQIGKWIAGEDDSDSWVARSQALKSDYPQPGLSVYLFNTSETKAGCSSTAPTLHFDPHLELISLGFDISRTDKKPLFDANGYTLNSAELRAYLVPDPENKGKFIFGAAAALDGIGIPLGPDFGKAVGESSTNPVAQNLLESGSKSGDKNPQGDTTAVNPAFSISAAYIEDAHFVVQLYDKTGQPATDIIFPIQRSLGPLHCEKLGIGWSQDVDHPDKDMLSLLFDGGVKLATLDLDLVGLSIGIPIETPSEFAYYDLDLQGMGLEFKAGAVELSAAFVKVPPGAGHDYTEYDGEVMIKGGTFLIEAVGSYAYVPAPPDHGYASLFIFGAFDGDLGGPEFFFVTGIAAGFGYNRKLVLPAQDGVATYPLVEAASDPAKMGDGSPAEALKAFDQYVPPERGEYWLAAGIRFTSFDLIQSTALITVEFGHELEIALLGTSWISLPPPAVPGAAKPTEVYAYAELGIEVKVLPAEGMFSATAILTPSSFVIDPACKLTGGFAFYVWFGDNPHSGQFVLTLGGYHPDFMPPSYFPKVPRLGFNWPVNSDVSIDGNAYFALTPSAVMAGGNLQVLFHSGNLKAWFKAWMNALIVWAPLHYELDIGISIGVSYRLHLLFVTKTIKVELGADVNLWGPKMGGKAHVHFYIVSFTVGFGADSEGKPPPLSWHNDDGTGFAQTLLPHKTEDQSGGTTLLAAGPAKVATQGVVTIAASQGVSSNLKSVVTGAAIIDGGSGYDSAPTVTVAAPPSGGTQAKAVAEVADGKVTGIYFTDPGSGYKTAPQLTIDKPTGGTTATAVAGIGAWIVRPNHFEFSVVSTIPLTELDIVTDDQGDKSTHKADGYTEVDVRPMSNTLTSSTLSIELKLDDDHKVYDLASHFQVDDYVVHAVQAAKWGPPVPTKNNQPTPEPNQLLPNRLMGLGHIRQQEPTLTPDPVLQVAVKTAFTYDVVDDLPENVPPYQTDHLPLAADAVAVGEVPHADPNAAGDIQASLDDAAVGKRRSDIFSALREYGVNPQTDNPPTAFAKDPAAYLNGNPLICNLVT